MAYIAGLIGFIFGFMAAMSILRLLLRGYSREELIENKDLHRKYGPVAWIIALSFAVAAHVFYNYISSP